jgi:hypothetical protein
MTETPVRTHEQSIIIEATPEALYDLVSDITRTGEWSPVCTGCWWDDAGEAGQVGAWFTGRNELPERTWETRSQVVAADRGEEFAWIVGGSFVRWGFTFDPDGAATKLTESWEFLPSGIAMFEEKYGDRAAAEIDERTRQAHDGIPRTHSAIKRIAKCS